MSPQTIRSVAFVLFGSLALSAAALWLDGWNWRRSLRRDDLDKRLGEDQ